jgi:diguanylate cyclase (GGDEF)-like protein/PAS domain S-box-containing protein
LGERGRAYTRFDMKNSFAIDPAHVLRALPDITIVIDARGTLVWINDAAPLVLDLDRDAWLGRSVFELVHEDDHALVMSSIAAVHGKPRGTPIEVRIRDGARQWRLFEVLGADLPDQGLIACVVRDITERRMWEIGSNDLNRVQRIVQHAASIVMLLDATGIITTVNGAFGRLLGHDPTMVVGHAFSEFLPLHERILLEAALAAAAEGARGPQIVELHVRNALRRQVPVRVEVASLLDDPLVNGFVVTGSDITELRATRTKLEYLATHDSLTGLRNRAYVMQQLERYVGDVPLHASVAFIDLDDFKPINDAHGHEAGDEALAKIAQRMLGAVRPTDTVARMGGDEFVVLAPGLTQPVDVDAFAHRLAACFERPLQLAHGPVRLSASIGCVTTSMDSTVTSVLAAADHAMYTHKAARLHFAGGVEPGVCNART